MRTDSNGWRYATAITAALLIGAVGCGGGDDEEDAGPTDDAAMDTADAAPDTMMDTDMEPDGSEDAGMDTAMDTGADTGSDGDAGGDETEFMVQIKNVSNASGTPTPFAPGTWAVHSADTGLFQTGQEASDGLEQLAEDGGGGTLADSIRGQTGIASTGSFGQGPIGPGASASFTVTASPDDGGLSMASMLVQTNDVFVAPTDGPIPLFENGQPMEERDVTDQLGLFDAGTERNQAPWFGSNQAPRQSAKDTGPSEGVVAKFDDPTRSMPLASGIADVSVSKSNGEFTIALKNVSTSEGAFITPIAPVFWTLHDDTFSFFQPGESASSALETLAEDGSPADLVSAHQGASGVGSVGAQPNHSGGMGPAPPGETFEFSVSPSADHRRLSFAAMVVNSNDVFLAPRGGGIALLNDSDQPRSASAVEAALTRRLAIWDAGTERNEVPGVGPNQAPRQSGKDTGPEDPNDQVRLYSDATNDLAGENAGGFLDVSITHGDGSMDFDVTVENTSGETVYPGALTPVAWAVHSDQASLFETGSPASDGLELLAEAGDPSTLASELTGEAIDAKGVQKQKAGGGMGPLKPGESYSFTVTASQDHRFLSIASMVVPSNDTFVAFGPSGIELVDQSGDRKSENAIAMAITSSLRAWDAGSEANQAGAAGPDQAPRQASADAGPSEGDGTVRALSDTLWAYPQVDDVLEVTVKPAN